jgi:hypothetical protein
MRQIVASDGAAGMNVRARGEEIRVQPAPGGLSASKPSVNCGLEPQHAVRQFATSHFVA